MKPLGDRRSRVRLEVLGTLRGTLELSEPARLVNISAHGALIETSLLMTIGSFQELLLTLDGGPKRIAGRVRRVEHVPDAPWKYLVALEFLSPLPALTETLEEFSRES
jgi:PilZ domain-containing protein